MVNRILKYLSEGLSPKAKVTLSIVMVIVVVVGSVVAYKLWDYKENNPRFCVTCHLMDDAFEKWEVSSHKDINCHECHHLSLIEQNKLLITLVLHNPQEVPERHGKVIVPWKYCTKCHVEGNEKFPSAPNVGVSAFHKKHFDQAKLECTKCHGYKLHEFAAEPKFCVGCHPDNEPVHGMPELACLNCHNDKSENLIPGRDACLLCHGDEAQRTAITADLDNNNINYIKPTEEEVAKASKMATFPAEGAMAFECNKCHNPHGKIKLTIGSEDCSTCHEGAGKKGQHQTHIGMGLTCKQCHKPHKWTVTKEMAKSAFCTQCHGVNDPAKFLK